MKLGIIQIEGDTILSPALRKSREYEWPIYNLKLKDYNSFEAFVQALQTIYDSCAGVFAARQVNKEKLKKYLINRGIYPAIWG